MTGHIVLYLSLIAIEGLLTWAALSGSRARGWTIREVIGGRWPGPIALIRDMAIAAGFWAAFKFGAEAWMRARQTPRQPHVETMLPNGAVESVLWVLLSLSAGFAEEVMFRGYLQRRLQS